jgi:hypothetical protein
MTPLRGPLLFSSLHPTMEGTSERSDACLASGIKFASRLFTKSFGKLYAQAVRHRDIELINIDARGSPCRGNTL